MSPAQATCQVGDRARLERIHPVGAKVGHLHEIINNFADGVGRTPVKVGTLWTAQVVKVHDHIGYVEHAHNVQAARAGETIGGFKQES